MLSLISEQNDMCLFFYASLHDPLMSSSFMIFVIFRHPDKNSDPEAQEKFIKINEAHEVCHKEAFFFQLLDINQSSKRIYEMY